MLCLSFCSTFSQEWIPLNGKQQNEAVTMAVLQSDDSGYRVKVTVNGLYDKTVQNEKGTFHFLSFGRVENLLTMGSPALPCINQIIAIPPNATMSAHVVEEDWKDLEMGLVYPAQSQFLEENKVFHMNDTVYQYSFLPSIVKVGKESTWRGIRHSGVSVCPFKYYPQENRLSVLCSFTLNVEFAQKRFTALQKVDSHFGLFDNTVYKKESLDSSTRSSNDENYNYLIIVGFSTNDDTEQDLFNEKLKHFRIWKALKGFKTKVELSSSIYDIRSKIREEKTKGVSYVLLIGDNGYISLSDTLNHTQNKHIKGDYWYGCEPGTDEADIPVGRFSIESVADFENMVDKTIKYENCTDIYPLTMLIAHKEDANNNNPYTYQGCSEAIRTGTYTTSMSFWTAYGAPVLLNGNNATNQYVTNEMRTNHYNIINYRGHGGVSFWGNPDWNYAGESFTSSEISNMDSTKYSVFFSIACNTGNIASDSICMLETFTRSNRGAVTFIGGTNATETGANSDFDRILFQKLLNCNVYRVGDLNIIAHIQNIQNYNTNYGTGNTAADNAFAYLCGGDPTLELWTDSPTRIDATVTSANDSITVNIGSNLGCYTLNVVSVNGDLISSTSCSNLTHTFPIPADQFFFSIDKHNYVPYVLYYDRTTNEITDVTFTYNAYFEASPLMMNSNTYINYSGPVIVKPFNRVHIKNGNDGVYIDSNFKCEKGAIFEVK